MAHKIQWLNIEGYKGETWNPIIGCSKVSDGCKNCYAERMAYRLSFMPSTQKDYLNVMDFGIDKTGIFQTENSWNGKTHFVQSAIDKPLRWKKPRVIFVCSMGDLFHEDTSFLDIDNVFSEIACNPQHIFIILTKRGKRMADYINDLQTRINISSGILKIKNSGYAITDPMATYGWPLPNVWLGVTAENQETANERIPYLLSTPAAVRLVSVEPMLSKINLTLTPSEAKASRPPKKGGQSFPPSGEMSEGQRGLHWVICGGESGHGARPMHPDWARSLRDQCQEADVPFFFKQWGEWMPMDQTNDEQFFASKESSEVGYGYTSNTVFKVGRKAAGNLLDGKQWEQYPQISGSESAAPEN